AAASFDAAVLLQAQIEQDAPVVHQHAPPRCCGAPAAPARRAGVELDRAASAEHQRTLPQASLGVRVHRPEALAEGSYLDPRRARHQLLAEDRQIAPALEWAPAAAQARARDRWGSVRCPRGRGRYA